MEFFHVFEMDYRGITVSGKSQHQFALNKSSQNKIIPSKTKAGDCGQRAKQGTSHKAFSAVLQGDLKASWRRKFHLGKLEGQESTRSHSQVHRMKTMV